MGILCQVMLPKYCLLPIAYGFKQQAQLKEKGQESDLLVHNKTRVRDSRNKCNTNKLDRSRIVS